VDRKKHTNARWLDRRSADKDRRLHARRSSGDIRQSAQDANGDHIQRQKERENDRMRLLAIASPCWARASSELRDIFYGYVAGTGGVSVLDCGQDGTHVTYTVKFSYPTGHCEATVLREVGDVV